MGRVIKKNQLPHPALKELKRKKNFRLRELIEYANVLFPAFTVDREYSRGKGFLSERTVRYYIKEDLIDKPVCYKGGYAFFSYRHILQTIVIKYLQSNEKTLKEIYKISRKLNNRDLEAILLGKDNEDTFFEKQKTQTARKTFSSSADIFQTYGPNQSNSYTLPSRFDGHSWRRFRVNDWLELHIMDQPGILTNDIDIHSALNTIVGILKNINQRSIQGTENLQRISGVRLNDKGSGLDLARQTEDRPHKVIALVTEGGLVPLGNPDRLESAKSKRFLRYSLRGIDDLRSDNFESVSGGWDSRYVNADPDRLLPVDVMREIENKAKCLKVHEYFYTTTGAAMSLEVAKKIGENIAQELKRQGVSAVIFTST